MRSDHHFVDGGHPDEQPQCSPFCIRLHGRLGSLLCHRRHQQSPVSTRCPAGIASSPSGLRRRQLQPWEEFASNPTLPLEIDPIQSAMLIFPGGDRWECGGNPSHRVGPDLFRREFPVAAICAATLALAARECSTIFTTPATPPISRFEWLSWRQLLLRRSSHHRRRRHYRFRHSAGRVRPRIFSNPRPLQPPKRSMHGMHSFNSATHRRYSDLLECVRR